MIFQIRRLERGRRFICRQVLVKLTSGSPLINLRNKRQVENGQPAHQHQSSTADQQCEQQSLSAVLWQSYMAFVQRICISWSGGDLVSAFDDEDVRCEPQSVSSSAAVLQYFDWITSVSWQQLYATAQDIQNVVEYSSSNCQDSGSVSHRRGAASSRHTYCICFLADRTR